MIYGVVVFATAIGVVLLTSLIKNVEMSDKTKALIAAVVSIVGAGIGLLAMNNWSFESYQGMDIMEAILSVYGSSQLIYKFIFKDTAVDVALEQIETIPTSDNG